jgi:nitroreductase
METLQAIRTRRSIRKFTSRPVPQELITKIVEAAMYAPSARDTQPWHFIIVNRREILDEIPKVPPYAEMVYQAPLCILVCGDNQLERKGKYLTINCAAATQNLLLAAHDLGLGAVWLGVYPRRERMEGLSKLLQLPENILPISLIALGYPDEKVSPPERFKQERLHFNKW